MKTRQPRLDEQIVPFLVTFWCGFIGWTASVLADNMGEGRAMAQCPAALPAGRPFTWCGLLGLLLLALPAAADTTPPTVVWAKRLGCWAADESTAIVRAGAAATKRRVIS